MSEERYDLDYKARIDELLLVMPGVKGGKAFGCPAYKVNNKVFAFVRRKEIGIKLPAARVASLIAAYPDVMGTFEPGRGIVWKEWLTIRRDDVQDYEQDVSLLEEAVEFVLG